MKRHRSEKKVRLRAGGKTAFRGALALIALYLAAACWAEGVFQFHRLRGTTPGYQKVVPARRYLPPAFVRWFDSGAAARALANGVGPFEHPLGTDNLGRDVARRLLQGTRIAFHVGVVTSAIAIPLGVLLGCLGGYFGGKVDAIVLWLCSTISAMPGVLFVLAVAMVFGKGLGGLYAGIGLTTWVGVCRSIRAEVIRHRRRPYVNAARLLGYGHGRILFRHILPNVMHVVLVSLSLRFPAAVGTEVFVSFLGIGVQNEPSWGIMINNARLRLWQGVWWEMTFVTLAILGLVFCFNLVADTLRDAFDPALRNG